MTSAILTLASELQAVIIAHLGPRDLLNLSSTCTFFRSLLAPRIFRKIKLGFDAKSIASVDAAITQNFSIGGYVRELRFVAQPEEVFTVGENWGGLWPGLRFVGQPGEVNEEEQDEEEAEHEHVKEAEEQEEVTEEEENEEAGLTEEEEEQQQIQKAIDIIFPPVLHSLLSNLGSHFPNLSTLSLELNLPLEEDNDPNFYVFEEEESSDEVLSKECYQIERALLAKVYSAICENNSTNGRWPIKQLELKDVMPKEVSTWRTVAWHSFLGQLESFEISIVGGDNGAGWCINTLDGYHAFIAKLSTYFFDHLQNATSLTIRASIDGLLGLEGVRHSPLPLARDSLPKLREFTLGECFVGPELIAFLIAHAQSLESVRLEGCSASVNRLAENGICWHTLFDSVAEFAPGKLRTFVVMPDEVSYEYDLEYTIDVRATRDVREVWRLLEEDKRTGGVKRCFAYGYLDDMYGNFYTDEPEVRASFMKGQDQRAWERLMGIVAANNQT